LLRAPSSPKWSTPNEIRLSKDFAVVLRHPAAFAGRVRDGFDFRFRTAARGGFITDIHAWQTAEAVRAYESGGSPGLGAYLGNLHRFIKEHDYLTDAGGKDLLTGEDRSDLLKLARPASERPQASNGHLVMVTPSPDKRYRLISLLPPPFGIRSLLPYYFLILVAIALVCWMLALNIARPLRDLSRAVERFGRGDLDVRLKSRRKDEIGELSRSFDRMAERIGTLVTAERRLLQDVSHELRSPLARLSFAAELTRRAPDRDAAVERLKKEIDRLTDLVGALVEVTRAEGDPSATQWEPLQLGELLRSVVDDCRVDAEARGCSIGVKASSISLYRETGNCCAAQWRTLSGTRSGILRGELPWTSRWNPPIKRF
jgi:signal transduction histidine kinase